ncbi:hypothetical protein AFL94_08735 [Arthrobacter sp. LS16]|nr:hypothetical protein AFL94_08735 [Arthrobacter sp. LS16]
MTILAFDCRIGGGSTVEVLTGTVDIVATSLRTEPSFVVLPEPTTIALHGGKATSPNLIPSPGGTAPEWAYKITITDGFSRRAKAFLVQVPESGNVVPFASLPLVEQVNPSMVNIGKISAELEQAAQASEETFVGADIINGELVLTRNNGQEVNLGQVEGAQGLPGPNAVPADEAVARYIGTAGSDTQGAADSRYMRTIAQAMPPAVTEGALWIETSTGKLHYPVDRGLGPVTNLASNPSFESETQYATIANPATFVAVSQNLRYSNLDTGVPGQNWNERIPALVQSFAAANAAIIGCQENNDAGIGVSQTAQLATAMGNPWKVCDGSANNGILYKSTVFEQLTSPVTLEINKIHLQPGTQRTMTYAFFRHIESGRRIIFAVTHFVVDTSSTANNASRTESAHFVAQTLMDLRAKFSDRPAVILTGDFNQSTSIPDSPFAVFSAYGLKNVRDRASSVVNGTLNSYNGFDPNMAGRQDGAWVDGVFTTEDVTIPSAGIFVRFATGASLPLATPLPSDHNMIASTVAVSQIPAVRMQGGNGPVTSGASSQTYRSAEWSLTGETSLCNDVANATSAATGSYPAGQAGAIYRLGWQPGKTYTVSASVRLATAQTGTLDSNARRITIGITQGTTNFAFAVSPQAPNMPGVYRLSVTFTIPADASNAFIRLMNGSSAQKIWWDNLIVTEGDAPVEYFNGDDLGCSWLGSPHASPSVYAGPTWVQLSD